MRAVVQRVSRAAVRVKSEEVGKIGLGVLVLVAAGIGDTSTDATWLADKVASLRIFPDSEEKLNRALADVSGAILAVSQFTLFGDCGKGRRPSFVNALPPGPAEALYREFIERLRATGLPVETGRFRTTMEVELVNDGPVTLLIDSRGAF